MKQWISGVAASLVVLGSAVPMAMAAPNKAALGSIALNNDTISQPYTLTKNGGTYMPVWYVIQALKKAGIQSKWNGHAWNLTSTNLPTPTTSSTSGSGNVAVFLNGVQIATIATVTAKDPASHGKTAYVDAESLTSILKQLNITSTASGKAWNLVTPDIQTLVNAFSNTQAAPQSQMTGSETEDIQLNLTSKGKSDPTFSGQPTNIDISTNIQVKTGTVDGEKAAYTSITMNLPADLTGVSGSGDDSASAVPQTIQEYLQGSKLWMNEGNGWTEETADEQLIQSLESQMPGQNMGFSALRQIQSSQSGDGYTYTATLDTSSLTKLLAPLLETVTSTASASGADTSGVSSSEMASILSTVLKQLKGSMQITVQPVNGQNVVTSEQLTMDMNLPISSLPIPAGGTDSSLASDIDSIGLHETMSMNYTYDDSTPFTPPADLNTSSDSTSDTGAQ
ncbi:hypothetical protein [Alicyclobacillus fodiniaquatilis]|uniref:Copper amine oxidase-like N-terminal domain-containing protein n=1 Tax=Alicyclobacillus fodiniaquatilis TaxID=1661150 RepID=A0ABW4JIQ0_9BACL